MTFEDKILGGSEEGASGVEVRRLSGDGIDDLGDDGREELQVGDLLGRGGPDRPARARASARSPDGDTVRLQVGGTIDRVEWRVPFIVFQVVKPWAAVDRPDREETLAQVGQDRVALVEAYLNDVILRDLMAERERLPEDREYDFATDALADIPALLEERIRERAAIMAAASVHGIRERAALMGLPVSPEQLDELLGGTGDRALAGVGGGRGA